MIYGYQQEELRSYCRSCIESLEIWSRRIIHEKMVETYGEGFLDLVLDNGEYLIKKDIRNHVHQLKSSDSTRIKRTVDALFLDDIIYFLCNPKWYSSLFKPALDIVYPQGKDEAREFLTRLIPIRNSLSHSNPISVHDAERAICYTHDFVEGIKQYYRDRGEERMWNVPQIIRITDSRGNIFTDPESSVLGALYTITPEFHLGEEYSIVVDVDPSFERESYKILWEMHGADIKEAQDKNTFQVKCSERDIAEQCYISCKILSNKSWHRYHDSDHTVVFVFSVLPL